LRLRLLGFVYTAFGFGPDFFGGALAAGFEAGFTGFTTGFDAGLATAGLPAGWGLVTAAGGARSASIVTSAIDESRYIGGGGALFPSLLVPITSSRYAIFILE
jgi:hypothetical protein